MRVRWPRVLRVRRADPLRLSIGDEAVADFGPGLLRFLNFSDAEGRRIGDGCAPEWVIAIAAAGTAAYGAVDPGGREDLNWWTGVSNTVRLHRACTPQETLLATASLEKMGRSSARIAYRVSSREKRDLVAEGAFVFVSAGPKGAQPLVAEVHPIPSPDTGVAGLTGRSSAAVGPPPAKSWKARIAEAVLPRSVARGLRIAYWHFRAPGGSGQRSVSGLFAMLRAPAVESGMAPRSRSGRLLDLFVPAGLAAAARRARWDRRGRQASPERASIGWTVSEARLGLHETAQFHIEVRNGTSSLLDARVEITMPYGFGLETDLAGQAPVRLPAGETAWLTVSVLAQRPDEVNLGRPWPLVCTLRRGGETLATDRLRIAVADPDPGTLFYVLTEDCETFDGGEKTGNYGAARVLGNHNDFMDPEDYRVQMIEKPEALNSIADRHGARWTHFWTAPQRFAAQWAARQSRTGAWDAIVRDLDESVRRGSRRHEYAPHIHFDFEPDSKLPPQPRLRYDPETDGLLPVDYYDPVTNVDHKYHGWDGARKGIAYVRREGDLADGDSKKGSLRKSARFLAGLTFGGPASMTVRTGAADFGATREDLGASARALFANGFLANSDAGVYAPLTPLPRGRQLYFCRPDDLESEVEDLEQASVVEIRPSHHQLEQGTLEELNAWFDGRVRESQGPGVRAIVGMTHAMFMRGAPDPFRDTKGGAFERLDRHLEYVRRAHPGVRFATASEAILEFLDYSTPIPRAVPGRLRARSIDGRTLVYAVRILGRGIPISTDRPAELTVQAPPIFDPESIESMTVLERGAPLDATRWSASPGELPSVSFSARRRDGYDLRITATQPVGAALNGEADAAPASPPSDVTFEEPPEAVPADLFRLEPPRLLSGAATTLGSARPGDRSEWLYPADLLELLRHPVSGGEHPLGRRFHPYGRISEGMAVDLALRLFGATVRPERLETHWIRPVRGGADFRILCTVESSSSEGAVLATSVLEFGAEVATVRVVLRASEAPA
jgi:hypothetical protein